MYSYAQLNEKNVVVGISQLSGEILADHMINITDLEVKPELLSVYDPFTKTFTAPVEPEPIEPQPTLEEMQAQTLINTELLVAMAEIGL